MVIELAGINQQFAILMARLLQVLQHFICTGFGISTESYRSKTKIYAGIGQGNLFSGEAYKTKSSRIIKNIKIKDKGVIIESPISKEFLQYAAITFMNDTSFYSGGEEFQNNINKIMSEYEKLCEAIGSLVEHQKSHCYTWQWKRV